MTDATAPSTTGAPREQPSEVPTAGTERLVAGHNIDELITRWADGTVTTR